MVGQLPTRRIPSSPGILASPPPAPCLPHSVKGLRRWPCRFPKSGSCLVITLTHSRHHPPGVSKRGIGLRRECPFLFIVMLGLANSQHLLHRHRCTGVRRGGLLRRVPRQPPGEVQPGLGPLHPAGHCAPRSPGTRRSTERPSPSSRCSRGGGTRGKTVRPAAQLQSGGPHGTRRDRRAQGLCLPP